MLNFRIYFSHKYKINNKNQRKISTQFNRKIYYIQPTSKKKAIKTVILKILKSLMAKGTKLLEFEKGDITALKRIGKSQREISKALGCSKTVICNYLKSRNKHGTRKLTGKLEKLSPKFKRRIVCEIKKENLQWMLIALWEQLEGI